MASCVASRGQPETGAGGQRLTVVHNLSGERGHLCARGAAHFEEAISYLVLGAERAALIDTGMGIADIRAEVERLTDLPVTAVNTHSHYDHVGREECSNAEPQRGRGGEWRRGLGDKGRRRGETRRQGERG
jgi:glyoxylase-like metal-dependent hydrolase (beta-lactamase superfamily II)